MHTDSSFPSLHLSVHKAAQPNANFSASVSLLFHRAHTNAQSLSLSFILSLSLTPPHLQSLQKLFLWVARCCFLSPFLFNYFLNEETVESIICEKPLTQFPGSRLAAFSAFAN